MTRGHSADVGSTRTAANGYHYTKTPQGWRLTHHVIAERSIGRALADNERVLFKDGNRNNLQPGNLLVRIKVGGSLERKKAHLEARIEELQAELAEVNKALSERAR